MKKIKCIVLAVSCSALLANAGLPDLAPPKVQMVDEFGVNVHSGQVQSSLETVSIGGAMGLSHSISNYTNNFSITGFRGYQDKYYTKGRVTELDSRIATYKNVMRVHDTGGSVDFELLVDGVPVNFTGTYVANYTYRALGDTRNTLVPVNDRVVWTKPDGTEVRFERGSVGYPDQVGLLRQIKLPNGFTIDVDNANKRVTTNTGFALKYIHQYDVADAMMEASKYGITNSTEVPAVNAEMWATHNPKYVQAINTSIENCLTQNCTKNWPKAEFKWPAGMPRAIFLGDSTLKVTDSKGAATEFYFRGFDLAYNGTTLYEHSTPLKNFSPRLIGIKPAGSSERVYQYTYKNIFDIHSSGYTTWFFLSSDAGQVTEAKRYNQSASYGIGEALYDDLLNTGSGFVQRVLPKVSAYPGAINSVTTRDGVYNYELSYRNFPTQFSPNTGPRSSYGYDPRGNQDRMCKGTECTTALYPTDCLNPKTCNQPTWIKDAKGQQTDYTYHAASGQVETVTQPANKNGYRSQTRYEYTQKRARYFDSSGTKIDGAAIWLKTAERFCINSNFAGACGTGDQEVVTRYEYDSDNLLLTGMTVTADSKTLRTCFQYDIYGNQIGKTQPKAGLTSCPR